MLRNGLNWWNWIQKLKANLFSGSTSLARLPSYIGPKGVNEPVNLNLFTRLPMQPSFGISLREFYLYINFYELSLHRYLLHDVSFISFGVAEDIRCKSLVQRPDLLESDRLHRWSSSRSIANFRTEIQRENADDGYTKLHERTLHFMCYFFYGSTKIEKTRLKPLGR